MNLYDLIFYLFALLTIVSGFFVVSSKNIVHSAFNLIFTFFGVTGLYVLLGADFLAIVQIMVYIGGILVLLLFGVMLTHRVTNVEIKSGSVKVIPAVIGVGIFAAVLISLMLSSHWKDIPGSIPLTTIYGLGKLLVTDYVLIFELLAILLLVAMIGAASIARREKE